MAKILQLTEYPSTTQDHDLLACAGFIDLPTAGDIRTDNIGSWEAWDAANRAETMLDLTGLTAIEVIETAVWYASVLGQLHGTA